MPWPSVDLFTRVPHSQVPEHFPGQLSHSSLQVRDGNPSGIFQIIQRVQDLFSRVAPDVGTSGDLDQESCLWLHFFPLCRGHSTLRTDGALVEFASVARTATDRPARLPPACSTDYKVIG